jgi:hypothetical protein
VVCFGPLLGEKGAETIQENPGLNVPKDFELTTPFRSLEHPYSPFPFQSFRGGFEKIFGL